MLDLWYLGTRKQQCPGDVWITVKEDQNQRWAMEMEKRIFFIIVTEGTEVDIISEGQCEDQEVQEKQHVI